MDRSLLGFCYRNSELKNADTSRTIKELYLNATILHDVQNWKRKNNLNMGRSLLRPCWVGCYATGIATQHGWNDQNSRLLLGLQSHLEKVFERISSKPLKYLSNLLQLFLENKKESIENFLTLKYIRLLHTFYKIVPRRPIVPNIFDDKQFWELLNHHQMK